MKYAPYIACLVAIMLTAGSAWADWINVAKEPERFRARKTVARVRTLTARPTKTPILRPTKTGTPTGTPTPVTTPTR